METDGMDQFAGFLDVPLELDAVLARRTVGVRTLLDLKPGSLVCTSKSAGDGAELFLGGVFVGAGEITVAGDKLAVRITSL